MYKLHKDCVSSKLTIKLYNLNNIIYNYITLICPTLDVFVGGYTYTLPPLHFGNLFYKYNPVLGSYYRGCVDVVTVVHVGVFTDHYAGVVIRQSVDITVLLSVFRLQGKKNDVKINEESIIRLS